MTESERYLAAVQAVRDQGCRCILCWNGERVRPFFDCEQRPAGAPRECPYVPDVQTSAQASPEAPAAR